MSEKRKELVFMPSEN